ncbi:bifunctional adenosylcobinamide kinase/adenosylcobinamide-phosphate guanylyltransferase, partial [Evtepia gabavorous]|uniref:bifunctional adenosylcobinamide kinase/adenosylcobinamide-phosphate guanylyltransferase n=1 Tax=Evtepia gabavorous TaxID=2211183 RepID=UPI003A8D1674
QYEVVIAPEVGGGVVPVDPVQRQNREAAGRLACLLAQRADRVIRVFCGLPQALKGELP